MAKIKKLQFNKLPNILSLIVVMVYVFTITGLKYSFIDGANEYILITNLLMVAFTLSITLFLIIKTAMFLEQLKGKKFSEIKVNKEFSWALKNLIHIILFIFAYIFLITLKASHVSTYDFAEKTNTIITIISGFIYAFTIASAIILFASFIVIQEILKKLKLNKLTRLSMLFSTDLQEIDALELAFETHEKIEVSVEYNETLERSIIEKNKILSLTRMVMAPPSFI